MNSQGCYLSGVCQFISCYAIWFIARGMILEGRFIFLAFSYRFMFGDLFGNDVRRETQARVGSLSLGRPVACHGKDERSEIMYDRWKAFEKNTCIYEQNTFGFLLTYDEI